MSDKVRKKGRDIGRPVRCGAHLPGHDVHYIQWGLSLRANADVDVSVTAVDDDGTIHFADGTTQWNHEPARLRQAIEHFGGSVLLGAQHVLKVPNGRSTYWFCLGNGPTPCPGRAEAPTSLEDAVTQAKERGGFLLPGRDLLRLVEERNQR